MIGRVTAVPDISRQYDDRNFGSGPLDGFSDGLALAAGSFHQDGDREVGEEVKEIQGFAAAVRGEHIEFCGFQDELANRERLDGFWFRHQQSGSWHGIYGSALIAVVV
jgi:hypothetical protein